MLAVLAVCMFLHMKIIHACLVSVNAGRRLQVQAPTHGSVHGHRLSHVARTQSAAQ